MFEKVNSLVPPAQSVPAGRDGVRRAHKGIERGEDGVHSETGGEAATRGGDALRAIDWGELNARLGAARDLRLLLRRDARSSIEPNAASFGDAAARYFAAIGCGERPVNPDGLEARKASSGILAGKRGDAAKGDARDDS